MNQFIANLNEMGFYQLIRRISQLNSLCFKPLEFKTNLNTNYPITDIAKIYQKNEKIIVEQNLISLLGQNGLLPDHFLEHLLELIDKKDYALRDFLDIFSNQFLHQFYQSWARSQIHMEHPSENFILKFMSSLMGCSMGKEISEHFSFHLHYASIFKQVARSRDSLEKILIDYFELPMHVIEFDGQWVYIDTCELSTLDKNKGLNKLGSNCVIGKRSWLIQHQLKIIIGPVNYDEFLTLLPNQKKIKAIRHIVKHYCGSALKVHYKILIDNKAKPPCKLKNSAAKNKPYQLGWTTWLNNFRKHP